MNTILENWVHLQVENKDFHTVMDAIDKSLYQSYLTHSEEKKLAIRDQWGNWDIQYNQLDHRKPFLDIMMNDLLKKLNISKRILWPNNAKLAVVFSHDLDMISENDPVQIVRRFDRIYPSFKSLFEKVVISLKKNKYRIKSKFSIHKTDILWCYERWIDEAKTLGMKNTFFIYILPNSELIHFFDCDYSLSDTIVYRNERILVRTFLQKIKSEGVEIGLHGSYNSFNNSELFNKLKLELEDAIGEKVKVTRQHYLKYDINSTQFVHSDNDILVDSTLGFNRGIGFRAGTSFPYFLESGVLEIPQIVMDGALFRDNSLELNEEHAKFVISNLFEEVANLGGCITFNFHQNYLHDKKYWNTYKFALAEAKKWNAWSTNMEEIYNLLKSI